MAQIKIDNVIYGSNNASDIFYKNTTVEEKLDTIPVFDPSDNVNIEANQYDYLTYGHIIDNLNSSAADKVLSANQGRVLKESIENIDFSELENGITSLNSEIDNLNLNKANKDELNTLSNSVNDLSLSVNQQYINSGYGRIRFKWDDSTGYLRAAVDNTENVANFKGHVTVPFSFGVDANGNYGYIKDGADTVTPFKSNNLITGYSSSNKIEVDFGPNKTIEGFAFMNLLSGSIHVGVVYIRAYNPNIVVYGAGGYNGSSNALSTVCNYNKDTGKLILTDLNKSNGLYYAIW